MQNIAILGAGLVGRLLAYKLIRQDRRIRIYESRTRDDQQSAAYIAAAMLAPLAESTLSEHLITKLGIASLLCWPDWIAQLNKDSAQSIFFQQRGTLVLWHPQDQNEAQRFYQRLDTHLIQYPQHQPQTVHSEQLALLEPALAQRFTQGLYLPGEGQLDNHALLNALCLSLEKNNVEIHWEHATTVHTIDADLVIDCRGLGAKAEWHQTSTAITDQQLEISAQPGEHIQIKTDGTQRLKHINKIGEGVSGISSSIATSRWSQIDMQIDPWGRSPNIVQHRNGWEQPVVQRSQLRGVRGEVVRIHAPGIDIQRPIRLIHPRYPLYIAPKPNDIYVIGATHIESEDSSPVSVRSALELLSAAYSIHPGFGEARILEMQSQCRPALTDNLPKIRWHGKHHVAINGLYRHGYLIAPAVIEAALAMINYIQNPHLIDYSTWQAQQTWPELFDLSFDTYHGSFYQPHAHPI